MKKILSITMCITLVLILLSGCANNQTQNNQNTTQGNAVKTGYAVISLTDKSKDAAEGDGLAQVDSTVVAVTVDDSGKITNCIIDAVQTKIGFNASGKLTTDIGTKVKSKLELGTEYGMKKASSIGKEWSEQVTAFSNYVVGKTVDQINGIAVNETGEPTAADLKSSVTISVSPFISAIEKAVTNAKSIGAKAGDKLGLGIETNIAKSTNAGEKEGLAQAYSNYAISTFDANGKITSCIIDASQTGVNFSTKGTIISNKDTSNKTKNEIGEGYGMKKASSIGKEWFEQADSFAKYVVGKTADEIKGISVNDKGVPTVNELKSSVTVSMTDHISAIQKAKNFAK